MRNEKQVIYEILNFAENNDMVRAVIWNGSRNICRVSYGL